MLILCKGCLHKIYELSMDGGAAQSTATRFAALPPNFLYIHSPMLQTHRKPEGTTFSKTTVAARIAPHNPGELFRHSQPGTETTVYARGRVINLLEDRKQAELILRSNADARTFNYSCNISRFGHVQREIAVTLS